MSVLLPFLIERTDGNDGPMQLDIAACALVFDNSKFVQLLCRHN